MNAKKEIIDLGLAFPVCIEIYLFGSSVYSESYNDIDLAIVYDKSKINMKQVVDFRKKIEHEINEKYSCSCDIILLSIEEEMEMSFLLNAKTEKIKKNYRQQSL